MLTADQRRRFWLQATMEVERRAFEKHARDWLAVKDVDTTTIQHFARPSYWRLARDAWRAWSAARREMTNVC